MFHGLCDKININFKKEATSEIVKFWDICKKEMIKFESKSSNMKIQQDEKFCRKRWIYLAVVEFENQSLIAESKELHAKFLIKSSNEIALHNEEQEQIQS